MGQLEQRNIYPIARIVVFKDKVLARQKPEWSFLNPDGELSGRTTRGEHFVNPYIKEIWEYNVEVAKQAVQAGFKEIQFDYVRFPEGFEQRADRLIYERDDTMSRTEAIIEFVRYAREQLNPLGVRVSVDIFGLCRPPFPLQKESGKISMKFPNMSMSSARWYIRATTGEDGSALTSPMPSRIRRYTMP